MRIRSWLNFHTLMGLTRIATVAVFLGRAWQHLRWDAPFRDLLWDEKWIGPLVKFWGYGSWEDYVTDPNTDTYIQNLIQGVGWLYVLCAIAALFLKHLGRPGRWLIRIGGFSLIFLAALYAKEKFFFIGQFWEYTLQWSAPFFLTAFVQQSEISSRQINLLKIATALTFICHGLYAVGYYPRPEIFQTMVINILGVNNEVAIQFLNLVGGLDFIGSALLFVPWKKVSLIAVAYLCFWGFMTTIARVWAFVYWDFLGSGLEQWLHQSVYRLPHFLMPLVLVFAILKVRSEK